MANNNITMDFASLKTINDKMKNELSKLNNNINTMTNVGKFSKSEWNDTSADTFNNAMDSYIQSLKNFSNVVDNINSYLNKKMDDYKSLDRMKTL